MPCRRLFISSGRPFCTAIPILSILMLALLAAGCSAANDRSKSASPNKAAVDTSNGTTIELEPSPEGFPMGLGVTQGFALHLFDSPGANQGFKKQPAESGSKRHYDEFTLAGKIHLVITEESAPPKFYFDENRNGDLTDDRSPATGEDGASLIPNHYSIHVRYDDEKVIAPYRMWLFGSNMGGVRFYPKCHWHGTLMVNDKPYRIIAFDGNADGDYANDPVIVDVDGNDRADDDEKLTPGKSITIDGRDVTFLEVSPSGLTARFRI